MQKRGFTALGVDSVEHQTIVNIAVVDALNASVLEEMSVPGAVYIE